MKQRQVMKIKIFGKTLVVLQRSCKHYEFMVCEMIDAKQKLNLEEFVSFQEAVDFAINYLYQ